MREAVLVVLSSLLAGCRTAESDWRTALVRGAGVVRLPAGVVEVSTELRLPAEADGFELAGHPRGTILRAAAKFRGRALLVAAGGRRIRLRDLTIDGNRGAVATPAGLPPGDVPFARFSTANGVLADSVDRLTISNVRFREIAGFAILVARSRRVDIERVTVESSGGRQPNGRNNATGGILIEEGTAGFQVRDSVFRHILGNAVWTHSLYTSPRNSDGRISGNRFETIGRDAIQIGHATRVAVEDNSGARIGYPADAVDVEGGGTPVAIDTAGNVDASRYLRNRFEEINGKCVDLDGFHHGEVRGNTCLNTGGAEQYPFGHYGIVMNNTNPDMQSEAISITQNVIEGMKFGGLFVIGSGHRISGNRFLRLNTAGCNENAARFGCSHFAGEPDLLQTGIYLGRRAERPARTHGNTIEDNEIAGHGMRTRCVGAAPGVALSASTIRNNRCSDQ